MFKDVCTGYDAIEHPLFCGYCVRMIVQLIENDNSSCLEACTSLFHWRLTIILYLLNAIFFWHYMHILKISKDISPIFRSLDFYTNKNFINVRIFSKKLVLILKIFYPCKNVKFPWKRLLMFSGKRTYLQIRPPKFEYFQIDVTQADTSFYRRT